MKRRRVEGSADRFSVDDVIGDVITISRWFERAVARISSRLGTQTQEKKKQRRVAFSRKIMYQSQATVLCIQSTKISAEDEFSHSDKSAGKQLTTYEELSKLDVNC
ncbi:hypothetical protein F511_33147 [Dorcoceras hygrometricum]|uniref:Uncharacterized protein n=1 Tax=Dorcoceras hygrometricum TaxID=472368 RepID=A0A2Z7BD29_9LAMI|nr:hypothetical protein F511_33147 [Dorcoceras hygrometricum]